MLKGLADSLGVSRVDNRGGEQASGRRRRGAAEWKSSRQEDSPGAIKAHYAAPGAKRKWQQLDHRPPPYPTPPGHGRPGPTAREQLQEEMSLRETRDEDRERERMQLDHRWYYNRGEELREAQQEEVRREERWGHYGRLRRDTLARAAYGGAGHIGDGIHVVRAEGRGLMRSSADMPRMKLPVVFPADVWRADARGTIRQGGGDRD